MKLKKIMTVTLAVAAALAIWPGISHGEAAGSMVPRLARFFTARSALDNSSHPGGPEMPPPHRGRHGSPLQRCIGELDNISSETRASVDALVKAHEQAGRSGIETVRSLRETYIAELTASPHDDEALAAAQAALITRMQSDMQGNFELDASIIELLSSAQLSQLAQCMADDAPPPPAGIN